MIVEKMFWDVWKNVTSGTSGWSFGSSSNKGPPATTKSAQRTRYNRLKSSGYRGGAPTKSISQPANLTGLCSNSINIYSSSESLEETDNQFGFAAGGASSIGTCKKSSSSVSPSNITPKGNSSSISGRKWPTGSSSSMKHSISSFFPFISCSSNSENRTNSSSISSTSLSSSSKNSRESSEKTCSEVPVSTSSFTLKLKDQQKEPLNLKGIGLSPSTYSAEDSGSHSLVADGSSANGSIKVSNEDDGTKKQTESSSSGKYKKSSKELFVPPINPNNLICEDDISDLDDDVEHLTCDVCDRAFPTLKQLAAHQRKKRHYGCLQCDSIFPSREVLEYHREQMSHYDYVIDVYEDGDEADYYESDDENGLREDDDDEERERLL